MRKMENATKIRVILGLAIIGLGIGSRASTTGLVVVDKYLGDALYAAMFFVLGTIVLNGRENLAALVAALIVGSLELFQRSNIPLEMSASAHPLIRLAARLIGTEFGYLDILSYGIGICLCFWIYRYLVFGRSGPAASETNGD